MYNSFYGFTETPFNLTPDPRYLFLSSGHREALDHLLYGINERKGFILITGGIGAGKTTLCRVLLNHLENSTRSALIFNSYISDIELLKSINQEFGIEGLSDSASKKDYIDRLNDFLLKNYSEGGNAILLIDEAQNLSISVLEQIRMLSNLETEKDKLLQIILVGQPELKDIVSSPSLKQLNERISVRYYLNPLEFEDIKGYIEHRMTVAGGRGNLRFTNGALNLVFSMSQGIPRRINSICDRSLLIAYTKEQFTLSRAIVKKALSELYETTAAGKSKGTFLPGYHVYLIILLFLIIAALLVYVFQNRPSMENSAQVSTSDTVAPPVPAKKAEPAIKPVKKEFELLFEEMTSVSKLFDLFYSKTGLTRGSIEDIQIKFVSYSLNPEYYITLKRPFRVTVSDPGDTQKYLIFLKTEEESAIVMDTDGNPQTVSRQFILEHWGGDVSWIYPLESNNPVLYPGVSNEEVMKLQKSLTLTGYLLDTTGVYSSETQEAVTRFQKNFGLRSDGIAGPVTRALLYQMVE